jgi:hypothetical protein
MNHDHLVMCEFAIAGVAIDDTGGLRAPIPSMTSEHIQPTENTSGTFRVCYQVTCNRGMKVESNLRNRRLPNLSGLLGFRR